MTTSATDLLATVASFGVTGIVIRDPANSATWTLQGTVTDRAAAIAALTAALRPVVPAVSTYWPPAATALERDVAVLKARLTGS